MTKLSICLLTLAALAAGHAEVVAKKVQYKQGETVLEGYLAYDSSVKGRRPAVLIFHDWNGIDDYEMGRARQLAALGYVAFAADVYGRDVRPKNNQESAAEAGKYRGNRPLTRARAASALARLVKMPMVDARHVASIGYCFGGMVALELARAGKPVVGTVSFHGTLDTPTPKDASNIKGRVLVLHGKDDPAVPAKAVDALRKEMTDARVPFRVVLYPGAVHSFTEPSAGNDPSKGSAYNAAADKASWAEMKRFLGQVFSGRKR